MRAGELDRRADLLRRTQTGTTKLGEAIYSWAVSRRLWVSLTPKSEGEQFVADKRIVVRAVTFKARYFSGIEATDRIECQGIIYDVSGWHEIGRREGVEIDAVFRE